MTAYDLFKDTPQPAFGGWKDEDGAWHSTARCGAQARIWRSALSGKWVLTIRRDGLVASGRVDSPERGRELAGRWLEEMQEVIATKPAPKGIRK